VCTQSLIQSDINSVSKTSFAIRYITLDTDLKSISELREFRLQNEPSNVVVLKTGFAIIHGLQGIGILDSSSETLHFMPPFIASSPLNVFRANRDATLICYEDGGIYVKSDEILEYGIPPLKVVRWELSWGKVTFTPPFVFGFSGNLVEVRNISTGALVQIIRLEVNIRHELIPSSPEFRDVRADFFKKWDDDENVGDVTSGDEGDGVLKLSNWGPIFLTSTVTTSRIVQLAPRSYTEFLDSRLFEVKLNM